MKSNITKLNKNNIEKITKIIEKNWIIILLTLIVLKIIITYKLPSFYLGNLRYDDRLMINLSSYLKEGRYLGNYCDLAIIKGIVYPIFLSIVRIVNIPFSTALIALYILACLFFIISLKKIIKSKIILLCIFAILLFNPISYSSDVFQRLYRNSIAYIELLFYFGVIIRILCSKKRGSINYFFLGIIMSIMLLTKEDNIWAYAVLFGVAIYKLYNNFNVKNILINTIPILIIVFNLNVVSYINYVKYGIYTYDELRNSSFKSAYNKILQIKDDEKIDKVAIPKSTLYKLAEKSRIFDFSKQQINNRYIMVLKNDEKEISNGNIVWYLRSWIYQKYNFKDGKEADQYYQALSNELDQLFNDGTLEREMVSPSTYIYIPTINEIKNLPKNLIKAIWYTSSYKNIKAFSEEDIKKDYEFDDKVNAYRVSYEDYHNAENIINNNPLVFESLRKVYKSFTIIFSIIALIIYLKNIKRKDKLNLILHIVLLAYLIIICGVTYTHTTAFDAIRYCYLSNIYILQNLFICLNLYRVYAKHREKNEEKYEIKLLERGGATLKEKISVIIPAYNEENAIGKTIEEIISIMKQNNIYNGSEIIVINDGSSDNTKLKAEEKGAIVIDNPHNIGYGYSLKRGIESAKNETIVITDADLTYPFSSVPEMLKIKKKGYDLVVGARTGKYYKQSIFKYTLRKILKIFVEYVSGKKIKDINSGLRVFDKTTVSKFFPRLCDTFSFTTSQTLAYMMNNLFVCYIDIPYNKREGKTKVKLFKDSLRAMRYILEAGIYYNPLKVFTLLTITCILLSVIGFMFSHFARINAGYILGIGGLLLSIIVFSMGILATLLKQIMDKK